MFRVPSVLDFSLRGIDPSVSDFPLVGHWKAKNLLHHNVIIERKRERQRNPSHKRFSFLREGSVKKNSKTRHSKKQAGWPSKKALPPKKYHDRKKKCPAGRAQGLGKTTTVRSEGASLSECEGGFSQL